MVNIGYITNKIDKWIAGIIWETQETCHLGGDFFYNCGDFGDGLLLGLPHYIILYIIIYKSIYWGNTGIAQ